MHIILCKDNKKPSPKQPHPFRDCLTPNIPRAKPVAGVTAPLVSHSGIKSKVHFDIGETDARVTDIRNQVYCFSGNVKTEKAPLCPKFVTECPANARLRFLADLIVSSGMPFTEFLRQVHMYYTTVQNYFENDNIKISTLCSIAECMGTKIVWDFNED